MTRREAWENTVSAEDYELHMREIGQAEANARLLRELIESHPPEGQLLIAGAGTGQMFDFVDPNYFAAYQPVCSDINAGYLKLLAERLKRKQIYWQTALDDLEDSAFKVPFGGIAAVLVLENLDWHKALETMVRLAPVVYVILQQDTESSSPGRTLPGTMQVLVEEARPQLVAVDELTAEFAKRGYELKFSAYRDVADGKRMQGLVFASNN
jgi:hypothetical protein